MLKTLLKSRLLALWASLSQGSKKKKKVRASGVGLIILFAFLAVYMLGAMLIMFFGMGFMLKEQGNEWAFFTLASLIATALCIFGSIFATKTQIFESKDNELLLSMPIAPKYILISRVIVLLIVNYALDALIMVPALIMYGITCGYTVMGFVYAILGFALIPFLSLAVSALIAWIISAIASKIRNKTIVTTIMFVAFFAIYMYACFSFGFASGSGEEMNIDVSGLKNSFVFYYFGNSVANKDFIHFLIFALVAIIPAIIAFMLISYSFISILTTKKTAKKIEYKAKGEKKSSPFVALVKKEAKRFFSSTAYMLNSGMGVIMTLIFSVIIAINAPEILNAIETQFSDPTQAIPKDLIYGFIPLVIAMAGTFMSSMNIISAPSISLEDKNLWILQSLPVRPSAILLAKVANHVIIGAPVSLISAIIVCVALKVEFISLVLVLINVIAITALCGYFGMLLGLKFPKFGWQNENVAVKQGFAVFGAMLGPMLYALILSVLAFIIATVSVTLALIAMIAISTTLCVLIHLYFTHGAEREFNRLGEKI